MEKRVITLQVSVDTNGHKERKYYQTVWNVKEHKSYSFPIKYSDLTSEEKHALLVAMGLRDK